MIILISVKRFMDTPFFLSVGNFLYYLPADKVSNTY